MSRFIVELERMPWEAIKSIDVHEKHVVITFTSGNQLKAVPPGCKDKEEFLSVARRKLSPENIKHV